MPPSPPMHLPFAHHLRCLFALLLALAALQARAAEFDGAFFQRSYSGSIGGKYAITMDLRKAGGVLRGAYRYAGKNAALALEGKLAPDGSFTLEEQSGGRVTGGFKGKLEGEKISGTWSAPKSTKTLAFEASQTAQVDLQDKAAVLRAAIGTYPLQSIGGSEGANGMYDTWREGRAWRSNFSSLSQGRREASEADLTPADQKLLNSMQVSVDANLTTRFSAGGKVLLEIPYTPGPDVRMNKPHNSVITDNLARYSRKQSVVEDALSLLLRDEVDYSDALKGSYELNPSDVLLVLYKPAEQAFSLEFHDGDCCAAAILRFTRK